MRRTTSIDQRRREPGKPQEIVASGRDLLTRADGTVEVVDDVRLQAGVDPMGVVISLEIDPPVPGLDALLGGHVSRGLRGRVDEALPDHRARATVLHQLLDDFPMAALLSSYGSTREMEDWNIPKETAAGMADLCAGWAGDGTMLDALDRTGIFPIPLGPPAPDLISPDDPLAWHDIEPMVPRSIRRRRRLDLFAGDPLTMDVHFRDSHLGADGLEDVLHEYTLAVDLDPALTVLRSEATVRVLPWPECPGAIASAGRIVGQPVSALRQVVAADFKGTSTCTHLNDVLRSLAGATALIQGLSR
ncbi:MAG: DUF2889 domain-containing protein [Acidimicrobiales bacterium]